MDEIKLIHTAKTEDLMAMSGRELESWFSACGLTVEVVDKCEDPQCPACATVEPARTAA